jgi:hypothetical protein
MVVSLTGSSGSGPGGGDAGDLEYQTLRSSAGAKIMTANDVQVLADESVTNKHNLFLGQNIIADETVSEYNTVFGNNVTIAAGVKNATSIGRSRVQLTQSNQFQIGSFLDYHASGTLSLLSDTIRASTSGVTLSQGALHVSPQGGGSTFTGKLKMRDTPSALDGWSMGIELQEDDDTPPGSEVRDLVLRSTNGTAVVFSDTFVPSVTNFTGTHRCIVCGATDVPVGAVLVATGAYASLDGKALSVDEAIPIVRVADRMRDPCAFGVLSIIEEAGPMRRIQVGNLAFDRAKLKADERRAIVNGCGEGGILVCSEGGAIANGDFLCTSSRPGLAMRQSEPYHANFTCAKATTSCTFDAGDGCPVMVGCVYKF